MLQDPPLTTTQSEIDLDSIDLDSIDLTSLEFWSGPQRERAATFARLRSMPGPVHFPRPADPAARLAIAPGSSIGDGDYYALTRYAEVTEASRNPRIFSSEPAATSLDDPAPLVREITGSMISMDDPRHARLRRIVSRAFTPRMIQGFEDDVRRIAAGLVDRLIERGPCDFVTEVAMPMPLEIICDMMGVPESEYDAVIDATNVVLAVGDPDYVTPEGQERLPLIAEKLAFLQGMGHRLGAERRADPRDDLVTRLVDADIDGEALNEEELGRFFGLLVVAGNETTRNAISHALDLFTRHPEQRDLLLADLDTRLPGAVEEVVRYATPVTWMRRNVTCDAELEGHTYRAGDRVVLFYNSADRDESVFADPDTFDITRSPNPHVGFGGPGPHFCLGAHLARREITIMLRELFTRLPGLHATAEPVRPRTSFINAISSLPCAF